MGENLSDVEASKSFEPLPPGWYKALLQDFELKNNKAGTGDYFNCTWQIIDGDFKNRKVFSIIVRKGSEKGENFGKSQRKAICEAIGADPNDFDMMQAINRPLLLQLDIEKDPGYSAKNKVKGWKESTGQNSASVAADAIADASNGAAQQSIDDEDIPF